MVGKVKFSTDYNAAPIDNLGSTHVGDLCGNEITKAIAG